MRNRRGRTKEFRNVCDKETKRTMTCKELKMDPKDLRDKRPNVIHFPKSLLMMVLDSILDCLFGLKAINS